MSRPPKRITELEAYNQALAYYGLGPRDPLSLQISRVVVEDTEDARALMAGLEYAALNDALYAAIGPAGSGKTAVSRHLIPRLAASGVKVVRICPLVTSSVTLRSIAEDIISEITGDESYRAPKSNRMTERALLRAIYDYCSRDSRHLLLLIDEAQKLSTDVIKALKRVWNEGYANYTLGIALLGQCQLDDRLSRVNEFRDRCVDVYHCLGLLPEEIVALLQARLGDRMDIISDEAVTEISTIAPRIYPQQMLQYMRQLIANGYRRGEEVITAETVLATPRGILWRSLMELHGISLRDIERVSSYSRNVVSQTLAGTTTNGYAVKGNVEADVLNALDDLITGALVPVEDAKKHKEATR